MSKKPTQPISENVFTQVNKRSMGNLFTWVNIFFVASTSIASAQSTNTTDRLFQDINQGGSESQTISVVREAALREVSAVVGAQAGLKERSCEIQKVIAAQSAELDKKYRFNSLMMGAGVLPPVISKVNNSMVREAKVMRIATFAYHIDEQAMLVDVAPTWRNWLYVGLDVEDCSKPAAVPSLPAQMRPRDDLEKKFVKVELEKAYASGRAQAQSIFEENHSNLERTYRGMRMYYDLFQRGMVSAPEIIAATDVVAKEDENTMLVGNTVIRISKNAGFVERHEEWKPLAP
jgi:defect-in-organelle-trafficking protein DotC